jgi:hypothetical protein
VRVFIRDGELSLSPIKADDGWDDEKTRERSRARSQDAMASWGQLPHFGQLSAPSNPNHNDNDSAFELLLLTISCIGNTLLLT